MKRIFTYIATPALLVAPFLAFAQTVPPYNPITNIGDVGALTSKIGTVGKTIGTILMAIAVIMILVAAFNFLTAGGNEDKLKLGRNYTIYALVGVAVALLAFALPGLIEPLLR